VILDGRLTGDAAKTAITAHLANVPIDTAVRLVADMADLSVVAMDNVLYVTSKANAVALQAERDKRRGPKSDKQKKEAADGAAAESAPPPTTVATVVSNEKPTTKSKEEGTGEPKSELIASRPEETRSQIVREIRAKLAYPVNLEKGFDVGTPLRDVSEYLSALKDLTILVNEKAFAEDLHVKDVGRQTVSLSPATTVSFGKVFQMVLSQVGGTYLVRFPCIEITTPMRAWPEEWSESRGFDRHRIPTVGAVFSIRSLEDALRELSETSGINVVLDSRLKRDHAQKAVTAQFTNAPIDTAVRLVADMANLSVVAMDNVLYVTSKANAAALQAERSKRRPPKPEAGKTEGAGGPGQ
jgi:hypothetical protein